MNSKIFLSNFLYYFSGFFQKKVIEVKLDYRNNMCFQDKEIYENLEINFEINEFRRNY